MKTVYKTQRGANRGLKLFVFIFSLITVYCGLSATAPTIGAQATYELLTPLPIEGGSSGEKITPKQYIEGLFKLLIGIAGVLAVIQIIFGGIKYMSTDAIQGKSDAKETIQNAIWGLLLAISAYLILNTINPGLTTINLNIPVQK